MEHSKSLEVVAFSPAFKNASQRMATNNQLVNKYTVVNSCSMVLDFPLVLDFQGTFRTQCRVAQVCDYSWEDSKHVREHSKRRQASCASSICLSRHCSFVHPQARLETSCQKTYTVLQRNRSGVAATGSYVWCIALLPTIYYHWFFFLWKRSYRYCYGLLSFLWY